ncbi:MAG: hypothetical protein IT199_05360 [Solirubrobacterales bacterium]|nr:hypothetical protein [Solirubrobacterales bacterium]
MSGSYKDRSVANRRIAPRLTSFMVGGLALVCTATIAYGASEIRLKLVDGKLCARGVIQGAEKSIPATIVIDLGTRAPLLVHSKPAKLLQLDRQHPASLRFGDLAMDNLSVVATDLPSLDELSNLFAPDLEEIPAIAVMGLPAFDGFGVQLDLAAGVLRLLPVTDAQQRMNGNGGPGPAPSTAPAEGLGSTVLSFEEQGYGYWLVGEAADHFRLRVRFATSAYDTIIDTTAADLAGSAAGAIDEIHLGSLNIAKFVAFRPEDLSTAPEPRPDLVLGTNLLLSFRVTIDAASHRMLFEQIASPRFPAEERAYFAARTASDASAIEDFLKQNTSSRLAAEASDRLLALRLDEFPGDREAILRAVQTRARMAPESRRSQAMVTLADTILSGKRDDRYDLATGALQSGQESARADLNGVAAHQINARLGLIAMRRGNLPDARRYLISAAFGIPRDPMVNLWLGEYYEKTGKLTRAWSRYVQAALDRNPPAEALVGLDRLNRDPAFRSQFTMNDAEQLLEGRVTEFHPAERYVPSGDDGSAPAQLVELFTCLDSAETTAPELAFGGLGEHFKDGSISFIEYHLSSPAADPLTSSVAQSRARHYGVTTAPAAYFDGGGGIITGGGERDADKIFNVYRQRATGQKPSGWKIDGKARLAGGKIAATLQVRAGAPVSPGGLRLVAILCEKVVMVPGANQILLHRQVARGLLTPEDGLPVSAGPDPQSFSVEAGMAEVANSLEKTLAGVEKDLQIRLLVRPVFVDAGACSVVAILEEPKTRRVLAAKSFAIVPESQPAL